MTLPTATLPTVSLLVAMRNEERYIKACLRSILAQDYPADRLEVVVLDGNSTDRSWQIVQQIIQDNCVQPIRLRVLANPKVTQAAGWNLGFQESTGDIVGIVSAHAELAPDYVRSAIAAMQRTGADMIGGPMRAVSDTPFGQAVALATSTPLGVGGARFHYGETEQPVDTVYMGLCSRVTFERIGGFDDSLVRNQDDEFSFRLSLAGGSIWLSPAIRSRYYNRATWSGLRKQYYEYGFWKVRVMQKHGRPAAPRHLVPATFVVLVLLSVLIALLTRQPLFLVSIAGPYLMVIGLVSLWIAARQGWKLLPRLVLVFGTLHIAYGVGFLRGLIAWNRPTRTH